MASKLINIPQMHEFITQSLDSSTLHVNNIFILLGWELGVDFMDILNYCSVVEAVLCSGTQVRTPASY